MVGQPQTLITTMPLISMNAPPPLLMQQQQAPGMDPRYQQGLPPRMPPSQGKPQQQQPSQQSPVSQPSPTQSAGQQQSPGGVSSVDQEKAALIMQVLQLTDDQIAMLPPEQRQSILMLKEQIAQSARL